VLATILVQAGLAGSACILTILTIRDLLKGD
jgi:hypothetical protein